MVDEAERFAEEDKKMANHVEIKQELEREAYILKNDLENEEELGAKLTASEKRELKKLIEESISMAEKGQYTTTAEFKTQKEKLNSFIRSIQLKEVKDEMKKKKPKTEL